MPLTPEERYAGRQFRQAKSRERKAAKADRVKSPKASRGREIDAGYLAFLRRQPCCVGPLGCSGPVEAAHIRFGRPGAPPTGLQRKPNDQDATPLCVAHHREGPDAQHRAGERAWWAKRGLDPFEIAAQLYAAYRGRG